MHKEIKVNNLSDNLIISPISHLQANPIISSISLSQPLADPGGAAGAPNRIQFFHFRICFCRKAYMLEVGAPQQEILDPQLSTLR